MKISKLLTYIMFLSATTSMVAADWQSAEAQIRKGKGQQFDRGVERRSGVARQETLTLRLRGEVFGNRGGRQNGTLGIKREIKRQFPRLSTKNLEIVSVTVVGRSIARRAASSTVSLTVNQRHQDSRRLYSNGGNRRGVDRVTLYAQNRRQAVGNRVAWQLHFDAATEVRRIKVQVQHSRKNDRGHGRRLQSLGTARPIKAVMVPERFRANGQIADRIVIKSLRNSVYVERVVAHFGNGRSRDLNLRGVIRQGQRLVDHLRTERRIRSITVHAVSQNLIGSRAQYEVLIGDSRRR